MKSSSNKSPGFHRRILWGTSFLTLLGGLAVTAVSCTTTLPDIDEGRCGNRVVETSIGEDCEEPLLDGDAGLDGAVYGKCGLPGSYAPCRYICSAVPCDPGYGCGLDGVCRRSDGLSDLPISIGVGARKLFRGDFDGDDRDEIVAADGNVATVYFLTTEGFVASSQAFSYTTGAPGIGDLNGDGLSDMVLNLGQSLAVWLGREDRRLVPSAYPLMYANRSTQRLIPLGSNGNDAYVLTLFEEMAATGAAFVQLGANGSHIREEIGSPNGSPGKIHGNVGVNIDDTGPKTCGTIAVEFAKVEGQPATANQIIGIRRCLGDSVVELVWNIQLNTNSPWAGAYFLDLDKDGTNELLYGTDNGFFQRLVYDKIGMDGKPAGNPSDHLEHERGNCDKQLGRLASSPLAIADLNNDGYVDFVDNRGILLSSSSANPNLYQRICHTYSVINPMDQTRESWTSAFVGDVNGDGLKDVIASRKGDTILDWWTWTANGFVTVPLAVPGPMQDVVGGDLDGDSLTDLVFRLVPPTETPSAPTLIYAMFGNLLEMPTEPRVIGVGEGVKQVVVGRFQGETQLGEPDGYDDVLILADELNGMKMPTGESLLTLIQGSPTRTLVAPLLLQENTSTDLMLPNLPGSLPNRNILGVTISDFGLPIGTVKSDANNKVGNILVALGSEVWAAGYNPNGSAVRVLDGLALNNRGVVLAPVDKDIPKDASAVQTTQLVVMANDMDSSSYGVITQNEKGAFSALNDVAKLEPSVSLPRVEEPNVPFLLADLDANGKRDIIVTGRNFDANSGEQTVVIYWNASTNDGSNPFNISKRTEFKFVPLAGKDPMNDKMCQMTESAPIQDIAALNFDADEFMELAILIGGRVYIAKLDLVDTEVKSERPQIEAARTLSLLNDDHAIECVFGANTLLSLDANSDGIDDLVVGDPGKLLLFFGAERQNQ